MELYSIKGNRLEWRGKEFLAAARQEILKRLSRSAELVKSQVQRNVSVSTRASGPSQAGEFPHVITGRLRNSIFWILQAQEKFPSAIVGTPLIYGLLLEMGHPGGKRIVPVNASVLAWPLFGFGKGKGGKRAYKKTGEMAFARYVIQGALAPRPFLSRTLKEQESRVAAILTAPMKLSPKP